MNEKYSTTIYVNSTEQCREQQFSDQQVNELYQNLNNKKQEIASNECNRLPKKPPIKPRLSLLSKKLIQNQKLEYGSDKSMSCEAIEQIDENLNLILKQHDEKSNVVEQLANDFLKANKTDVNDSRDSEAIYVNNDSLKTNLKFDDKYSDSSSDNESNYESSCETSHQLNQISNFLNEMDTLNQNTYISHAEVSEEMTIKCVLNDRLSGQYNELEEPIYSDIIFDDCNTIYDVPTGPPPPPPLPPRIMNNSKDELKADLKNEFTNELKNFHLKNVEYKSSQNSLNNSYDNNVSHSFISTNPFSSPQLNDDIRSNETKENSNFIRKDPFLSLDANCSLKKDETTLFDQCLDEFSASSDKLSKANKSCIKTVQSTSMDRRYGKINKVEIPRNQVSDDDGSLKSSFSFMDSQLNSSSNDTFSYKSVNSIKSILESSYSNKQLKPNIGVIAPFIRSPPFSTNPSTDINSEHQQTFHKENNKQKNQLTVQLNDEFKSTLNCKELFTSSLKVARPSFNHETNQKRLNDQIEESQLIQNLINQRLINEQLSQQNKLNHEIEDTANLQTKNSLINDNNNVRGYLHKTGSSRKGPFNRRWCVLSESALFYYNEEKQNLSDLKSQAKGHIELNDILFINSIPGTIQHQSNRFIKAIKSKNNGIELYQFNIGIHSENGRIHLMASDHANKRQFWVDILSARIRPKLKPTQHIKWENIDACGYLNIKKGLTGIWTKCFTIIQKRSLNIHFLDIMGGSDEDGEKADLITIDLRQVMSLGLNENAEIKSCETVYETGPIFFLNRRYSAMLFFQGDYKSHTEQWLNAIKQNWELPENGLFEDQLLTPNNIPIAIEKCLNFISTYNGIATKHIYQTSGDETCIKEILENLKSDKIFKWNILPEEGFTVQDVSQALLIYLKSFPECLLTEILYQDFLKLNFFPNYTDRVTKLKVLLKKLPTVNYNTLKKLICHFMLFVENSKENEMDLDNLSQAVCPYLIFSKISANPELTLSINLFKDLVNFYVWLFDLKQEELDKEREIENSLKNFRKLRVKKDEDKLLVSIFLFDKTWGKIVNVSCNSTMTADDLLLYVTKIANLKESPDRLCVCEVVSNDQLERVIHYSERIQQIILGWTVKWPQQDAKSNYLLIKPNTLYEELDEYFDKGMNSLPVTVFNEVRFSEDGNKFRKVFLEFSNSKESKFNIYKDAKATKSLKSWNLDDVSWYLGSTVQKMPTRYCITFLDRHEPIKKQKETIKSKIISFNTGDELVKWLSAIICSEHPEGIYPLIHLNE